MKMAGAYTSEAPVNNLSKAHIENIIYIFTKQATSMRRLTVLSFPP